MMRWKIIGHPCMQNISCSTRYTTVQNLSNKQSAKVICKFDRFRISHSRRQRSHMSIEKFTPAHAFNYIVLRLTMAWPVVKTLLWPLCGWKWVASVYLQISLHHTCGHRNDTKPRHSCYSVSSISLLPPPSPSPSHIYAGPKLMHP